MNLPPARIEDLLAHADWLRRLAVHVAHGAEADDVVQDTWVAALRSPPDAGRPPRPWLAEVLRNFVRRRMRGERRRRRVIVPAAPTADPAHTDAATAPSRDTLLERAEAQRILAELVASLPDPYRGTIMLRYYDGLSAAEIATAQRIPPGTVRWRLKVAIERLRAGLDARYAGDRRTWCVALLPLERPSSAPLTLTGALLMAAKTKSGFLGAVVVALLLLVGAVGSWLRIRGHGDDGASAQRVPRVNAVVAPRATPGLAATTEPSGEGGHRAGVIEGVVVEPAGEAVAGSVVALVVAAPYEQMEDTTALRPRATVHTSEDGTFRFSDVPPGSYLLTATANGWAPAELAQLALPPGGSARNIALILAAGGARLWGTVGDAGGGAIGGAAVRALALGAGGRPQGTRTFVVLADSGGRYELRLPRGSFRVVADAEGYAPESTPLWMAGDQRRNFRLAPAARVTGRVMHQAAPVAGARIRLESQAVAGAIARTTASDTAGAFSFENLPAGTYAAVARAGALVGRARQLITVAPGGAFELVLHLARGSSVAGVTRDGAGQPVPGALVLAGPEWAAASSDGEGHFRLEGLPPGRHRLTAEAIGHGPATTRVAIQGVDVEGVELRLGAEARVRGRVLDRNGRPLAGASVLVGEDLPNEVTTNFDLARTDGQGRYEAGGLSPGQMRVEAEHPDAGRGIAGPVSIVAGGVHVVDVRIGAGGGMVRGTVRWQDGKPAAGVIVHGTVRGRHILRSVADDQGRYEVGPFIAPSGGQVSVNAWTETDALGGSPDTAKLVAMTAGEDRDGVDLVIPRRDERIAGIVQAPDGSPLPGAAVGVAPDHRGISFRPFNKYASGLDSGNYSVLSDGAGAFTLRNLPKGKYTVWATHPDFPEGDAYDVQTGSTGVVVRFEHGASVAGRAEDGAGKPMTAFTVYAALSHLNDATPQLRSTRGYVQQWAVVEDPAGAFEVAGLHPAIYDLLVVAPDRRIGQLKEIRLRSGEARSALRVTLSQGARLKGRLVYGINGQPAAGLWVNISLALLHEQVRAPTGADGVFVLEGIPAGTFTVHLPGDSRTRAAQNLVIDVPAGIREHDVGTVKLTRPAPAPPPRPN